MSGEELTIIDNTSKTKSRLFKNDSLFDRENDELLLQVLHISID